MKTFLRISLALFLICIGASAAVPSDNPIAAHYTEAEGYPAWTDGIRWRNAIDMSVYKNGKTNFEKFENARDELAAKGGGVLYYPAGVYDFSDGPFDGPKGRGLMLKSGVVIRGERPSAKAKAREGELALGTKFVFGGRTKGEKLVPRDWNIVGLSKSGVKGLHEIHDTGIAWVHLTRATIFFGPEFQWFPTWGDCEKWKSENVNHDWRAKISDAATGWDPWTGAVKKAWLARVPDGTHPIDVWSGAKRTADSCVGAPQRLFVFGCVLEDAAVTNDCHDLGAGPDSFYMFRYGARISAHGSRIFIANNLLPKSKNNFLYDQRTRPTAAGRGNAYTMSAMRTEPRTIMWDYGKTCGIEVNKAVSMIDPRIMKHHFAAISEEAKVTEFKSGLLEPGVIIRDNFVYNHGHQGLNIAGSWVTIRDNVNKRDFLREGDDVYGLGKGWELTMDGVLETAGGGNGYISDNLSRGFDLAGKNFWIDGNWIGATGSAPGNDGEVILSQAYGGTDWLSWTATRNTHVQGDGKATYIGGWGVEMAGALIAWNNGPDKMGLLAGDRIVDAAIIHEPATGIANREGALKKDGAAMDVINGSHGKQPAAPKNAVAVLYEKDAVRITWEDASDSEIGFRIDRRIADGAWTKIAYRPRRSTGHPQNPQEWIDFTAPPGKPLRYRVVAIDEMDNDHGAAEIAKPITIEKPTTAG